ncbi:MAG: alpha/beta hydrolase [Dermatophilaceae bacterium]
MLDNRTVAEPGSAVPEVPIWNHVSNNTAWQAYLGGAEVTAYGVPARAQNVADLAPAYIEIGSADLFRDECAAYAARIWAAGGSAELHVWDGAYHGFDHLAAGTVVASAALTARASWFQRVLRTEG